MASAGATIPAPPEEVFALLADPALITTWRTDVEAVEILGSAGTGPAGAAGGSADAVAQWRETSRFGTLTMARVRAEAPRVLALAITDTDQGFGGSWTYELEPVDGGTRVVVTERGEVANPLFRFTSRYVMGYHATMLSTLEALGRYFGADVTPEEVAPPAS
jgi:uncharacterized protein YndB with AHSA1/START domain